MYDDWSGGEFGNVAPSRAPKGTWTGTNMLVYRDGTIGPRPGLKKIPLTGTPDGVLQGLGFVPTPSTSDPAMWFIIGDTVYGFRADGPPLAVSTIGTLNDPIPDGEFVWWKETTRQLYGLTYFVTPQGEGYKMNIKAPSVTALVNADGTDDGMGGVTGGKDIETYKERLCYADGSGVSTRVWFSGPADYDTWLDENYFDVGASWPVGQLVEYRDGLCIFTNSGQWLLTGALPNATLRRVSDVLPSIMRTIVRTNDEILFIPAARSAPVKYTGAEGDEVALRHLETWKFATSDATGTTVYGNRDVLFLSDDSEMLWRSSDIWSKHEFSVPVGPYITRYFNQNAILTDGGAAEDPANFYILQMELTRPAFVSDDFASPGDDSTTPVAASLRLPDYFAESGEEVRVRSVIVDYIKYDTGASSTNHMDLLIEGQARFRMAGTGGSTATDSWDEAGTSATTSGVRDRWVANVGQSSYHGGFRLTLDNLRGVKIDRILVDIETMPNRPRS